MKADGLTQEKRLRRKKRGGAVHGKKPKARLDRKRRADGGDVPDIRPTPRPPFGADDQKTEQPNPQNPNQTDIGHLNRKNGDFVFESDPDRIIKGTGVSIGRARGGKTPNFRPGGEKGKLHREMGIPEGQKIPTDKLAAAARSSDPEKRRDAIRAQTMKKWKH